ncbi:plastocyanin/azurin family copper-binding protein [Deinococcus sp. KSM4-11]|uniref:plastocyanin/azurin family copper-binding protein n=1 Tax=Deinococcus sp. KSM4-11 TaxID=2568654 RepID=UPI001F11297C|nr:plastocyanin/azurin family copper-binding protein [Deinococcus sp. KSM4-11]
MNKRMIVGTLSGLALLAVAMPSHAQDSTPAQPTAIALKLSEWTMGMDMAPMKVKGAVMFNVENAGKFPHALAIEGKIGGQDFEISTPVLKPGEKTTLMVKLPAGTYNIYCPVGKHEAQGMKADLVIE